MIDPMTYLGFDLLIEKIQTEYRVRVLASPVGDAAINLDIPLDDLKAQPLMQLREAQEVGRRLFEAVFVGDVLVCLRRSMDEAERNAKGLRIRLRLTNVPELMKLPWEYLFSSTRNRFFALSIETPIVRYLDLPEGVQPLSVKPPLKILVIISGLDTPGERFVLDTDREWNNILESLDVLAQRGQVTVDRLERPTMRALQQRLRQEAYHVLHFIGHGAFDTGSQKGILVFQDRSGREHYVDGDALGMLLHDHTSLRLVLLNACEGGRAAEADPFGGIAQALVQQGIPAVIAMQSPISDAAAIDLAHEFYTALSDGYPVDAALTEGRKTIYLSGGVEWGTPVLYMRAPDGCLFEMTTSDASSKPTGETGGRSRLLDEVTPAARPAAKRRADLEGLIRESYGVIYEYQHIVSVTDRPEERLRGEGIIARQWDTIKGYLEEYIPLSQDTMPSDIAEIAAHFPEFRSPSRPGSSSLSPTQRRQIEQRINEANSSWEMWTTRIEAVKRDLSLELDGQRQVVLQARLQDLERERAQVEAELARLEGQL